MVGETEQRFYAQSIDVHAEPRDCSDTSGGDHGVAAEVLAGYGFRVYMVNRSSPTPLMMFVVKTHGMPYGMAVTASHNPAIYNGIKVFTAGGRDADRTVTAKIEAEIEKLTEADVRSVDYDKALAFVRDLAK